MLTGKQRAALKARANGLTPYFQIGKGGINDNMVADIVNALEAHELVKISVLRNAEGSPRELLAELAAATGAEEVSAVGNKIVIYKRSSRDNIVHIEI